MNDSNPCYLASVWVLSLFIYTLQRFKEMSDNLNFESSLSVLDLRKSLRLVIG